MAVYIVLPHSQDGPFLLVDWWSGYRPDVVERFQADQREKEDMKILADVRTSSYTFSLLGSEYTGRDGTPHGVVSASA